MYIKRKIIGCVAIVCCCNHVWAGSDYSQLAIHCNSVIDSTGAQMKNVDGNTGPGKYIFTNSERAQSLDYDCKVDGGQSAAATDITLYGKSSLKQQDYQHITTDLWIQNDNGSWIDKQHLADDHGQINIDPLYLNHYLYTDVQFQYNFCMGSCTPWYNDQFYIKVFVCNDSPVPCRYNAS